MKWLVCSHPNPIWTALTLNTAIVLNILTSDFSHQSLKFHINFNWQNQVFATPTLQRLTPSTVSRFGLLATSCGYMLSKPCFINQFHPHHLDNDEKRDGFRNTGLLLFNHLIQLTAQSSFTASSSHCILISTVQIISMNLPKSAALYSVLRCSVCFQSELMLAPPKPSYLVPYMEAALTTHNLRTNPVLDTCPSFYTNPVLQHAHLDTCPLPIFLHNSCQHHNPGIFWSRINMAEFLLNARKCKCVRWHTKYNNITTNKTVNYRKCIYLYLPIYSCMWQ
jgi:hypothetical protein